MGIVVFVVSVEILSIDPLAEFGGQIGKAVEGVVLVVVFLKLLLEVYHCDRIGQ